MTEIENLKAKDSEALLGEVQQIAFEIRMKNMAFQEQIEKRIKVLRARLGDPKTWVDTEYEDETRK